MKKWHGIEELIDKKVSMPRKLWQYEETMREMPNFNKEKQYDDAKKVYEKDEYVILKVKSKSKVGYIAYNTHKEWHSGHSHLNSFSMAKTIISNTIKHKKPKTNNLYLIRSHARLSNDKEYINYIEQLIKTKENKEKTIYTNRSK